MAGTRLEEARLDLMELRALTGATYDVVSDLRRRRLISAEPPPESVSFGDACCVLAWMKFSTAGIGDEHADRLADRATCVSISRLPMMAFASEAVRARYDFQWPLVGTTSPEHVPERYIIVSGTHVCRVGTLAAYEEHRRNTPERDASIVVFDTKVAVESLIDAMGRPPYRMTTGAASA